MQIYSLSDLTKAEKLALYQNKISTVPTVRRNVAFGVTQHDANSTYEMYQDYVISDENNSSYDSGGNVIPGLNTALLRNIVQISNDTISFDKDTNIVVSEEEII